MDLAQSQAASSKETSADRELSDRARNAFSAGNFHLAETLCRQGLSLLRDKEGLRISSVGQAGLMNDLGDALAKQGFYKEAADVWEQCYRRLDRMSNTQHKPGHHKTVLDLARKLMLVYEVLGEKESANSWNVQVFYLSQDDQGT